MAIGLQDVRAAAPGSIWVTARSRGNGIISANGGDGDLYGGGGGGGGRIMIYSPSNVFASLPNGAGGSVFPGSGGSGLLATNFVAFKPSIRRLG
jgi:hypothetical protein